jgi:hypothetical protein
MVGRRDGCVESEDYRIVRLTAKEILKKFKLEGELIGFSTPTRQEFDDVEDKTLILKLKKKG